MSNDEREPLPPTFRPGVTGRRPDARGARPVGPDANRPARPRRMARPAQDALASEQARRTADQPVVRRTIRTDGDDTTQLPSFAPASRRSVGTPPGAHDSGNRTPADSIRHQTRPSPTSTRPSRRRRRRHRPVLWILAVLLVLVVAWPVGLTIWANGKIQHTEALSGATGTPGTTYLLAGSDSRADGAVTDPTEGQRSDTIMVMHVPESGRSALISLPRDTFVEIPGHGPNKLNAAFSAGGAPLLVETVENLTGLTVDHYVQIGMGGVQGVVDAVGGVELCLDRDVSDDLSGLQWKAGCHEVDGQTALAFARMRYADPTGDIGRTDRQRQVVSAVVSEVATPGTLLNPVNHAQLVEAATDALVTDTETGMLDLSRMALAFRNATGPEGIVGTPPIADFNYRPGGVGSTVLLADDARDFFQRLAEGNLTPSDLQSP
ncbi:LCP family protein [Georgenia subflava]|uniref:LytR family transcriptional regulator n=1 Tax=Georgenia subflava TaxID=1622177 RepID=A0A6N7EKJ6_9MICO|nr:LCP family protein [Georgenia subflava]MPV37608.1 LytR family transcriptional regulator [Georgenia subflava]